MFYIPFKVQRVFYITFFYWNNPREAVKSTESFVLLQSVDYRNIFLAFYIKIIKALLKCVTSRSKCKSIKLVGCIHFSQYCRYARMIKPKPLLAPENWIDFFYRASSLVMENWLPYYIEQLQKWRIVSESAWGTASWQSMCKRNKILMQFIFMYSCLHSLPSGSCFLLHSFISHQVFCVLRYSVYYYYLSFALF